MDDPILKYTVIEDIPLILSPSFPRNKVCYIALTCENYIPTRVEWQKQTCFRNTNMADCYFLSCKNGVGSIYGWNTADDYSSCITKYIKFFQNMNLDYDWYMFIDDDTFVFPDRVEQYLNRLDPTIPSYVGAMWSHIPDLLFMSGGAGFFLSKPAYKMLREFLIDDGVCALRTQHAPNNGDATMGVWIRELNRTNACKIKLFSDWKYLKISDSNNIKEILTCVSFHYVNRRELFDKYNKYLNITDLSIADPHPIIGFPKYGTNICFAIPTYPMYAFRHAYYKLFVAENPGNNDDFNFIVKPARNSSEGFSFQSVNYPQYYIVPHTDGLFISKDASLDDQSWNIVPNEKGVRLVSLSKNILWTGLSISIQPFKDVLFMSPHSEAFIQTVVMYEIPPPLVK